MQEIEAIIEKLQLQPHPEGGWYGETYRSPESIPQNALPQRFNGERSFSTAIYFLLPAGIFSAFHRIDADECWHFYDGGPLNIYVIDKEGLLKVIKLGRSLSSGEQYQAVVPAGCWFASMPCEGSAYSLVGCTVAPGFDFAGFEMADGESLSETYPEHSVIIKQLCR